MYLGAELVPVVIADWLTTQSTTDFSYRPSQTTIDSAWPNRTYLFAGPVAQRLGLPIQVVCSSSSVNSRTDFEIDGSDVAMGRHIKLKTLMKDGADWEVQMTAHCIGLIK